MKDLYDAVLDNCSICKDSWYTEEDEYYRIDCKCGIRTPWFLSRKSAEIYWNKILYRDSILNDN